MPKPVPTGRPSVDLSVERFNAFVEEMSKDDFTHANAARVEKLVSAIDAGVVNLKDGLTREQVVDFQTQLRSQQTRQTSRSGANVVREQQLQRRIQGFREVTGPNALIAHAYADALEQLEDARVAASRPDATHADREALAIAQRAKAEAQRRVSEVIFRVRNRRSFPS
ncbi:MAG: hypothetical protein K1X89_02980 [Myxococcaceae bacterium]|nr:hypothetical protein [Myxococcaceae bacterium]